MLSSQILMSSSTTSSISSISTSCCENGRPIMTDPHTGQTVCSCQYGSGLLSAYSRVPGLTDSMYSTTPYPSQGYVPLGTDPSAFYSPLVCISSFRVYYTNLFIKSVCLTLQTYLSPLHSIKVNFPSFNSAEGMKYLSNLSKSTRYGNKSEIKP